jgi:hypothetical protein
MSGLADGILSRFQTKFPSAYQAIAGKLPGISDFSKHALITLIKSVNYRSTVLTLGPMKDFLFWKKARKPFVFNVRSLKIGALKKSQTIVFPNSQRRELRNLGCFD